jgi:hypothetical protein
MDIFRESKTNKKNVLYRNILPSINNDNSEIKPLQKVN